MACQPGGDAHQHQHQRADHGVAVLLLAKNAADTVVEQPEHHQETQRHGNRLARRPVHLGLVDQVGAGAPDVGHREQRKTADPGRIAFPVKPVQVLGQLGRRAGEFDGMVEAAAMQRPQFTADTLLFQQLILGWRQAAVEEHKVERRADPGNGSNDVDPTQEQVGPVEIVTFHVSQPRRPWGAAFATCSPLRAL